MTDLSGLAATGDTRNLQLTAGDPGAFLSLGRQTANSIGSNVPTGNNNDFVSALTGLLQQYQQLGTGKFLNAQINASQELTNKIAAPTSPDLIGASPALQNSVRNAQASAINPTIQGAENLGKTFGEQIRGFGDVLKGLETAQNKARDDARSLIHDNFVTFGSGAFVHEDPADIAQIEKTAGLPRGYIANRGKTLKEQELQFKQERANNLTTNDYSADIQTTSTNLQYLDLGKYFGKDKIAVSNWARQNSIPIVSGDSAEALTNIDNARFNQKAILDQVQSFLPKDAAGRVAVGPGNKIKKYLQTNDQIAAFGAWRTAAINSLRATAGSKGLRINQAEIAAAVENDIPKITDTIGAANQKYQNIKILLDNAEKSILIKNRSTINGSNFSLNSGQTSRGLKYNITK